MNGRKDRLHQRGREAQRRLVEEQQLRPSHERAGDLKIRKRGTLGSVVGEPPAANGRDLRGRAVFTHLDSKRLHELAESAARGELKIPIGKCFPLAQVREAHQLAERGGAGKDMWNTRQCALSSRPTRWGSSR